MNEGEMWRQLRRQLSEAADQVDSAVRHMPGLGDLVGARYPRVDVYETAGEVVIEAAVPGVAKENLEVNLLGEALTIQGKPTARGSAEAAWWMRELSEEGFRREVTLPAVLDATAEVAATLRDGILTLRVQKKETKRARTIAIDAT